MFLKASVDKVVRWILVVAEFVALLLGTPLMLVLHLVQLIATNPIDAVQHPTAGGTGVNGPGLTQNGIVLENHELRHQGTRLRGQDDEPEGDRVEQRQKFSVLDHFEHITDLLAQQTYSKIDGMVRHLEAQGGMGGRVLSQVRRSRSTELYQEYTGRLPNELINHILLLAAMPDTPHGVPTKIALLSKAHHRLVTARLYANVHLTEPTAFRRFRMTLAVHNPRLGEHVRSLSVASTRFDVDGYLPDRVAEHVTLGVGIEQILLAAPNLQHLYLDLFSLAALHNGTAARLEKGALPISLTTEFSLPQYLSLPTFADLQHVELVVFGLDQNAVAFFREALPRLHTLTIRWVTRKSRHFTHASGQAAWLDESDQELDDEERMAWDENGRRRSDFNVFVEAIEMLRHWPDDEDGAEANGRRLDALSIVAWPKAYRELRKHYATSEGIFHNQPDLGSSFRWNHSLPSSTLPESQSSSSSSIAPLRICMDEFHSYGPRRGPLKEWCATRRAAVWPS